MASYQTSMEWAEAQVMVAMVATGVTTLARETEDSSLAKQLT